MPPDELPANSRSQCCVFFVATIVLFLSGAISAAGQITHDQHDNDDPVLDAKPLHGDSVTLNPYGHELAVDVHTGLAFQALHNDNQSTPILIGGLLMIALIITLLVLISRAKSRAVHHAKRLAATLRAETALLSETNRELEQFVYTTSHDLKTPIRGIGGLAQMLKEDLEEYCKTPGANPQVAQNLDHIQERVERMNDLIHGVLEYSRVNADTSSDSVIGMAEVVDAMASDFGLEPGQLQLDGSVEAVRFDALNFRRVLENLVGNAIKHHHDPAALSIVIKAKAEGDIGYFSVRDNGPGIDPRFHDRIFGVFETLRDSDAPESTGIGLAIVKKLVGQHGCAVTLTSHPGAGTEFRFQWPLRSSASASSDLGRQQAA